MAKFTLFLVHGIGIHRDLSWADETKDMLARAWDNSVDLDSTLYDHIKIVPISYDEVFEDYLDDFANLGKAVFSDTLELSSNEKGELSNTLIEHQVTDKHFLWSYLVDVVLYKMDIVKAEVNALVAKQLYEHISRRSTADEFGIVAHSLGTRVINDTLQTIQSGSASQSNFYQQGYRIKFLMQISDVTDLFSLPLNSDKHAPKDVYPHGAFDYLRTVTNRFDPIARMIPTRLDHWPDGRVSELHMGRSVYQDILLEHVHETNVHGLTHYMLHPEITDEVFDLCGFGRLLIEPSVRRREFPVLGPEVQPSLRTALRELINDAKAIADNSWQTYVNLVIRFGSLSVDHGHVPIAKTQHNDAGASA